MRSGILKIRRLRRLISEERLQKLYDVWVADRRKRPKRDRLVAIGWQPDETWEEIKGDTPSGNKEYMKRL